MKWLKYTVISLFIIAIGIFILTTFKFSNKQKFIIGAFKINNEECEVDEDYVSKENKKFDEDYEKYFRPSNLIALNNRKEVYKLIDQFYGKNENDIVISPQYLSSAEDTIINYFSLLKEAASPVEGKFIGCGSLGTGTTPYKITYNFFTQTYRDKVPFKKYTSSFENILHISLLKFKAVGTDEEHKGQEKYFYEIETIEGGENNKSYFSYYYGYVYLMKLGNEYKISDINIIQENYLCSPYHGWRYNAEGYVDTKYGQWCKMIKSMGKIETNGFEKNVFFTGNDDKEYKIMFYTLTNNNDVEIEQFIKADNGQWESIKLNPDKCIPKY